MTVKIADVVAVPTGSAFGLFGHSRVGPRICFSPETGGQGGAAQEQAGSEVTPTTTATDDAQADPQPAPATDPKTPEKPKPSDTEAKLLKEVMEKKGKIEELTGALNQANERLKMFDGIDPDQVRALLQEKTQREQADAEARGEFDRVKEMMAQAHAQEIDTWKKAVDDLKADYEDRIKSLEEKLAQAEFVINDLTIGSKFDTSTFIANETVLPPSKARALFGSYFDVENGQAVPFDKPRGAEGRTKLVGADGNALDFETAIKKLVEGDPDGERLIKSKMKPGAGSTTDPSGKGTPETTALSGRERIAAGLAARKGRK
jgi:hypothetical protein